MDKELADLRQEQARLDAKAAAEGQAKRASFYQDLEAIHEAEKVRVSGCGFVGVCRCV